MFIGDAPGLFDNQIKSCYIIRSFEAAVFPTPVGVFPMTASASGRSACLPHARGGVSYVVIERDTDVESSPRPWGCFYDDVPAEAVEQVFPTPVGVFPAAHHCRAGRARLPHARGGVSNR